MKPTNAKHSLDESLRGLSFASQDDFLAEVAAVKDAIASYATDAAFDPSVHVGISASEEANFADTPIRAAKAVIQLQASRHNAKDRTDLHVLSDRKALICGLKAKYHYFNEVRKIIETGFPTEGGDCGIVTQGPILARGLCPHHFLPVYYEVFVAYKPTPDGNVLGLSKLARVTKELAARPVLQEQLTADIASVLCRESDKQELPGIDSDGSAVQMVGKHTCFSGDTEILTPSGWIRFDELPDGMEVVEVDVANGMTASNVLPDKVIRQKNDKQMLRIKAPQVDLVLTEDHDLVYKSSWMYKQAGSAWLKGKAKDLPKEGYFPVKVNWQGVPIRRVRVDGREIDVTKFLKLLGFFFADGCWRGEGTYQDVVYGRTGLEFVQKRGPTQTYLVSLLNDLGFDYELVQTQGKNNDVDHFFVHSPGLVKKIATFGKTKAVRRVPDRIRNLPPNQIRDFLEGFYAGDGDKFRETYFESEGARSQKVITVGHTELANDIQELYFRCGILSTIHTSVNDNHHYRVWQLIGKGGSQSQEGIDGVFFRKNRIRKTKHHDMVYCVSVPKQNIVVRRKGKIVVVGNCMSCRGTKSDALTLTTVLRGEFSKNPELKSEFYQAIFAIRQTKI